MKKLIPFYIIIASLMSGCYGPPDIPPEGKGYNLSADLTQGIFSSDGSPYRAYWVNGSYGIWDGKMHITSDVAWEIEILGIPEGTEPWVTLSEMEGISNAAIQITVVPYDGDVVRRATLKLSPKDPDTSLKSFTIPITQEP